MESAGAVLVLWLALLASCCTVVYPARNSRDHGSSSSSSTCSLHHHGCRYELVLSGARCHGADDGQGASRRYRWARDVVPEGGGILTTVEGGVLDHTAGLSEHDEEDGVPVRKLEQLERKLVKMMEGLSVRSLRHIRQIKDDLRHVTGTIDQLRLTTGPGAGTEPSAQCPHDFVGIGTWPSCYRFSSFNATWHAAREYCSAFGANLVAMDTLKEAYILDYLIKSNPEFKIPVGWWTSANYIVRNRRWMWTTKHHLKPIDFSRWAPGEPDARSTMHCMLLKRDAGYRWHDGICSQNYNFICEIELA